MMAARQISIAIIALALTGCETSEERFARLLPEAENRCTKFGYAKGTDAYTSCLQSELARLEDKEDAEAQALADAISESTPERTTCYTTGYGIHATTTCY